MPNNEIIIYLSTYIPLIPVLIGIIRYSRLSIIQKTLLWMIVFVSINQIASEVFIHFFKQKNNLAFYRVYILVEFSFLSFIFFSVIRTKRHRYFAQAIGLLLYFFWILALIQGELWEYPTYLRFFEGCIILFYAYSYFLQLFREARIIYLSRDAGFWIFSGLTLYFASNSLLFLFSEFVVSLSDPSFYLIWTVHAVLTILLYIAFIIAIQCKTNHK